MTVSAERFAEVVRDGVEDLEHHCHALARTRDVAVARRAVDAGLAKVYQMQEAARPHVPEYYEYIDTGGELAKTVGGLIVVRNAGTHDLVVAHEVGLLYPGRIYPSENLTVESNWVWANRKLPRPSKGKDRRALYQEWLVGIPITQTFEIAERWFEGLVAGDPAVATR